LKCEVRTANCAIANEEDELWGMPHKYSMSSIRSPPRTQAVATKCSLQFKLIACTKWPSRSTHFQAHVFYYVYLSYTRVIHLWWCSVQPLNSPTFIQLVVHISIGDLDLRACTACSRVVYSIQFIWNEPTSLLEHS
jgi:hypothetical protein